MIMYVHACILSVLYDIEVADHIYTVLYMHLKEPLYMNICIIIYVPCTHLSKFVLYVCGMY